MPSASAQNPVPAGFAQAVLDYAEHARVGVAPLCFRLPQFQLRVITDFDGYADLCRRALVDAPQDDGDVHPPLALAIFDYARRPDMPRTTPPPLRPTTLSSEPPSIEDRREAYDAQYGLWQIFDRASWSGVEVLQAPGRCPPWIASFPLRNFLHWAYQAIGWRIIHAGTLGIGGKGVLLVGPGGAGKSGTSLSGIMGGLDSVGDDYVALHIGAAQVHAHPVIKLMKQDAQGLARLGIDPVTIGAEGPNWQGKYEFDFDCLGRGRRAPSLALDAILMPRIAGAARTSFTAVPPRLAMIALAPNNLLQLPGGWRQGIGFTAEIARRLPAYVIDLGTDPAEIADAIGSFIIRGHP